MSEGLKPGLADATAVLAWAREYSTGFHGAARFLTAHRPRICPFARLVDAIPRQADVFDIGCGNGLFLYLLARADRLGHGVGVDVGRAAVTAGNAALRSFGIHQASLLVGGTTAAWPTRTFDVVSMIDVMHHLPPAAQQSIVAAACAMIRPGGILVYKDVAASPAWAAWANRLHDLVVARQWIRYLPIAEVEAHAGTAGMRLERRETVWLAWYAHELRVFRRA